MKNRWATFFATVGWSVLALVLLVGCFFLITLWPDSEERKMEKIKTSMRNLESEVVRIELAGKNFDIPMRYLYGEAIEKYNQWPTAKKERVELVHFNLNVLLPDLRPYYPEDDARWKVLGHGDKVSIAIYKFRGPPENWMNGMEMDRAAMESGGFYTRVNDSFGLAKYSSKGQLDDELFSDDVPLKMLCTKTNPSDGVQPPSPGCIVTSRYIEQIELRYSYGRKHLVHWREIDSGLKAMFDQLLIAAVQSEEFIKEQ